MDAGADDRAASGERSQRDGDELAHGGEDDRRIELLRRRAPPDHQAITPRSRTAGTVITPIHFWYQAGPKKAARGQIMSMTDTTTKTETKSETKTTKKPKRSELMDINTASADQLKTLPGITDAEAVKIVQNRPYKEPEDLVSKKILSESVFSKIKDRVTAGHAKS